MTDNNAYQVPLVTALPAGKSRQRPLPRAGYATVCQCTDGTFVIAPELRRRQAHMQRYEVNTSAHFQTEDVPLPAQEDAFSFQTTIEVGWCVVDPVIVVVRNIQDGWARVRSIVLGKMRQISRRYRAEDCAAADEEINHLLGGQAGQLSDGLYISSFAARLTLDDQTRRYLQELRNVDLQNQIRQHRLEATRRALEGDSAVLVNHLTDHPGDTHTIIKMITSANDRAEEQRARLFKELLERDAIQDADLDPLSRELIDRHLEAVSRPVISPQALPTTNTGDFPAIAPATIDEPPNTINGTPAL